LDVLHAHLDNAHGTAARARRAFWKMRGRGRPMIVRSLYDQVAPPQRFRYRWLLEREADGVLVFSERVREALLARFRLSPERVVAIPGSVVTERFRPRSPEQDLRERFGIPREAVVVGIVARLQRHRRFEILFESMRRIMAEMDNVYLLVLGRGTYAREVGHDTVARLGIGERTRLPGYVGGDDYPAALASFDIKVFLVPGSDGTCRAVREAMACGVPIVASRRGLLPEIVRDGVDGYIVEDEVEPLTAAIRKLATDGDLRRRLGANALRRAREEFSQQKQAERVLSLYRRWLEYTK
jgi:glycosyltransferase involved in cell wall biosynthesis